MDFDDYSMCDKHSAEYYDQDIDPMHHQLYDGQPPYQRQYQCQQAQQQQVRRAARQSRKPKRDLDGSTHWVALTVDPRTRRIVCRSSQNLEHIKDDILSSAIRKLDDYMHGIGNAEAHPKPDSIPQSGRTSAATVRAPTSNKRRRAGTDRDVSDSSSQKESSKQVQAEEIDENTEPRVGFRVDQTTEWEKWFYNAFRAVQQVSCRVIAKEWIKTIHPKKQSTHPYNGKNPRTGTKGDPNSTRPPYWPEDVVHREPDHINKEARTKLLVHLLMNTPHQEMSLSGDPKSEKLVNAEALKKSLEQKKTESGMSDLRKKFNIVEQIITTRAYLEQYEAGGINADSFLQVADYSDYIRPSKNEDDSEELLDDKLEVTDDQHNPEPPDEDEAFVRVNNECKREPVAGELMNIRPHTVQTCNNATENVQGNPQPTPRGEIGRHGRCLIPHQVPGHDCISAMEIPPGAHPPMSLEFLRGLHPIPEDMSQVGGPYTGFGLSGYFTSPMDMSGHCGGQCMIPPAMMTNMNGNAYADQQYAAVSHHPPYADSNHTIQYPKQEKFVPDGSEQRAIPYRENGQHYGPYMMPPDQGSDMMPPSYHHM